jgi:fructose-specific phosphotransferase system IIC component
MDFLTAYAIYATGAILLVGAFAARVPHEDVAVVFLLAMFWPVTILAILGGMLLNATGWEMDLAKGAKMFGFRKPTNPEVKGFAFTFLYQEFQFFSVKKA